MSTFGTGATLSPTFSTAGAQLLPPTIFLPSSTGASGNHMFDQFNYAETQRRKRNMDSAAFEFFIGETGSLRYRSRAEVCQRDSIR